MKSLAPLAIACCLVLLLDVRTFAQDAAADDASTPEAPADGGVPEAAPPAPMAEAAAPTPPAEPVVAPDATSPAPSSEPTPPLARPLPPRSDYGAQTSVRREAGPGEYEPYGTGSRVNAPLRELPATVTLVDRQTLRERGVVDLNQALGLMAGVMPSWQYGGFQHIRVRGFQAFTLIDGRRDPRALLADSAPQAGLLDLERIELLRGPASVLYGYGATGGVVNLIRRRPSAQRVNELDVGFGLPNQRRIHVGAQGPAGPMLQYRVDMGHVLHENFRSARTRRNQLSGSLRFAPSPRHTVNLRISFADDRYNTDVGIPTIEDPDHPGTWTYAPDTRRSRWYGTRNDHLTYQRLEFAADYRLTLDARTYVEARGAIARDHYEYLAAEMLTYVPPTATRGAQVDREYLFFARAWRPVQGQLELHAERETGPFRHQLVAGYQVDSFGGLSDRGDVGDALPGPVDYVYPVDRAPRVSAIQRTAKDHYGQLTHALYAFDHVKLGDTLVITGGARLDAFRSRTRREFVDRTSGATVPDPATGESRRPNRQDARAVTGQGGVVYTPLSLLSLYAGTSSSFMPQIVYPSAASATHYRPERGTQVEGGLRLRADRRGHHAELDAASYVIQKRNIVIPRGPDAFVQAGKVRSRGLDLSVRYRAPRLVQLEASYALTLAEYVRFVSPDPVTGENRSRKGNQVDFAPRHGATAWLRLSPLERFGVGVGTRVMGEQFADPENRLPLPRYALLDASLWVRGEHATFTLSATNVLDERDTITSAINAWAPNPQVTPGPGREILGVVSLAL